MKSLVALLDRKKRSNTLLSPLPSSQIPTASTAQEQVLPSSTNNQVSTSGVLRPPASYRATSNSDLPRHPHLREPTTPQSPVQSIAYHNDPDDDTLADPFAASPSTKLKPTLTPSSYASTRQGSTPNLPNATLHDSFQNQQPVRGGAAQHSDVGHCTPSQTSSQTGAHSNDSASAPAHDGTEKERRLRGRRSFSNFFRPQTTLPTAPVPQVDHSPTRVPDRKSSFFRRGRSGSTPTAARGADQAHTLHHQAATPIPIPTRPQTTDVSLSRRVDKETIPATPKSANPFNETSPDSWVRVGQVRHDPSSPTNARPRALSVPSARPPKIAQPPLPEFPIHLASSLKSNKTTAPLTPKDDVPKTSLVDQPAGPGSSSASASISSFHAAGCGPLESNLRRRPSVKHFKRPSTSVSEEGHAMNTSSSAKIIRKSALKRSSAQTRSASHARQESRATVLTLQSSTPSSEGLKCLGTQSAKHRTSPSLSPATAASPQTPSSLENHGLPPSDSRTLPVLDSIWGSFKSDTAFGSLPSSPSDKNRATNSPGSIPRKPIDYASRPGSLRSLSRRSPWGSSLVPPGSPPVLELPPLPTDQPPALALPMGSVYRRKLSRGLCGRGVLPTPPVSPTDEIEDIQGLGVVLSTSAPDTSLLASSHKGNRSPLSSSRSLSQKLTRSASSPVVRSGPDAAANRSWLSVDLPRSRSASPSLMSESSSQCTPVPGTPRGSSSTADHAVSYLGISSGLLALSRSNLGCENQMVQTGDLHSDRPSNRFGDEEDSDIRLSMFPSVPLGVSRPDTRYKRSMGVEYSGLLSRSWNEEPLPTPPVTPGWFAQAFDAPAQNEQVCTEPEGYDDIPPIQLGGLARTRRQRHVQNTPSSSSNDASSDGVMESDAPVLPSRRMDWRSGMLADQKRMAPNL
ncbi:Treacle protein [Ceratobasidium sp. AG-Ba]|nr:Treacle protein [Ceratobasidium sp. AG-Ba]